MSSVGTNNIFSTGNTNFLNRISPTPATPMGTLANVAAATQAPIPQCNLIWKNTIQEVLDHPRTPNETLYFGNPEENIIYVRETDGNGEIKNPLHGLRYETFEIPFGQEAKFVTKDEFQQLYKLVAGMSGKLDQLMPTSITEGEG